MALKVCIHDNFVTTLYKQLAEIEAELARLETRKAVLAAKSRSMEAAAQETCRRRLQLEEAATRQRDRLLADKDQLGADIVGLRRRLMEKNEAVLGLLGKYGTRY